MDRFILAPEYKCEKQWGFVNALLSSDTPGNTDRIFILHCPRSPDFLSGSGQHPSLVTLGQILPWKQDFGWVTANTEQVLQFSPDYHQCAASDPKFDSKSTVLVQISTFFLFNLYFSSLPFHPSRVRATPRFAFSESLIPGMCSWFSLPVLKTRVSALGHLITNLKQLTWLPCCNARATTTGIRLQSGSANANQM